MITVKEETLRVTDTDSNTNQQSLEKFEKLITLPNWLITCYKSDHNKRRVYFLKDKA